MVGVEDDLQIGILTAHDRDLQIAILTAHDRDKKHMKKTHA
jgi:hypothetical protein